MKRKCFLVAVIILFTACQKGIEPFEITGDSTQTGNDITGTWNFTGLTAHTKSSQEYNDSLVDYKTITYSDYTAANATGSITFGDSDLTETNLGYLVSSNLTGYNYENGVLVDSVQMPFSIAYDSVNATGTYKLIGSDSIYFPEGFISVSGADPVQAQPSGGKYSISGNVLTLTEMVSQDTMQNISGIPYHTINSGTFIFQFLKK